MPVDECSAWSRQYVPTCTRFNVPTSKRAGMLTFRRVLVKTFLRSQTVIPQESFSEYQWDVFIHVI